MAIVFAISHRVEFHEGTGSSKNYSRKKRRFHKKNVLSVGKPPSHHHVYHHPQCQGVACNSNPENLPNLSHVHMLRMGLEQIYLLIYHTFKLFHVPIDPPVSNFSPKQSGKLLVYSGHNFHTCQKSGTY